MSQKQTMERQRCTKHELAISSDGFNCHVGDEQLQLNMFDGDENEIASNSELNETTSNDQESVQAIVKAFGLAKEMDALQKNLMDIVEYG